MESLIIDRLAIMNLLSRIKLKLIDKTDISKIYELENSKDFNLMKFKVEMLKTRYSNELVDVEDENNLITLYLRRVYLNKELVNLSIKFIKKDKLIITVQILNRIKYDNNGREYFI